MKSLKDILSPNPNTQSPIEEIVYKELLVYGLNPIPQYQVGAFFIDLAFPEIKLAIEADGKEFHSSKEQKERDVYRENKLKKLGWTFERFSGEDIHRNSKLIGAKIALKFFDKKLNEEQRRIAVGCVVSHFTKEDIHIAEKIAKAYQDTFLY